jgi:signal transduction histidine kinase
VGCDADTLVVEVSDDGVGGADARGGSGLTGLLDRVDALDGTLLLTSAGGAGTTLRATLPLSRPEEEGGGQGPASGASLPS